MARKAVDTGEVRSKLSDLLPSAIGESYDAAAGTWRCLRWVTIATTECDMRYAVLFFLLLSACGAVGLAAREHTPGGSDLARNDPNKPVNKFCPIERENEIDPRVTTKHDGKVVAFCCADCIDRFKTDPKKYMKDLK